MTKELLANALGLCLARLNTLNAVYIPEGVSESAAAAIVHTANFRRPGKPPFAILVSMEPEDLSDECCLRLTPQTAIQYRQDDRLAVVVGRHPDLASFVQAFREVLGQSYPGSAADAVSLEKVAAAALDGVLAGAGAAAGRIWNRAQAEERLASCLSQLSLAHEALGQGTKGWNTYWFEHVNYGLNTLEKVLAARTDIDLDQLFAQYTYACFALPAPKSGVSLKNGDTAVGKAIVEAVNSWWLDSAAIVTTAKQLAHHPDSNGEPHPVSELDWTGFDRTLAAEDNHLIALLRHAASTDAIDAFATLTEDQFFNPLGSASRLSQLDVRDGKGRSLAASEDSDKGPFVLRSEVEASDTSGMLLRSEPVRVKIPTFASPSHDDVEASALTLCATGQKTEWSGHLELDRDGALWAVGRFIRNAGKAPHKITMGPVKLTVRSSPVDPLVGIVDNSVSSSFYLLPPSGPGLVFMAIKRGGALGRATYVGPDTFEPDPEQAAEDSRFAGTFDDATSRFQILAWASGNDEQAYMERRALPLLRNREGIFAAVLQPSGLDEVTVNGATFELRTPQPKAACHSPVVAAATGQQISAERPAPETEESVRGVLESLIARHADTSEWMRAHGHIVLPSDRDTPVADLHTEGDDALLMSPGIRAPWKAVTGVSVPPSLAGSVEAERFREAWAALEIGETLQSGPTEITAVPEWPSRTSWRHLWLDKKEALGRYLDAYSDLIGRARDIGDPFGVFWATYPFSASVWDTVSTGKCQAVLLSPFHPLRLTWLAGVEATLWEAREARYLAGTIEGWNFPLLGPRETSSGRMVAVPMDNGEDQVFLGWSMLVEASIDGHTPLKAPTRLGNLPAPGSAASGLNATAAAAALRSYRNMNPHVSTLSIDLAAVGPTARLAEVDEAVLAAVEKWTQGKDAQLLGGARIWDSLHRGGEAPREAVTRLVRGSAGVPLTWSRYEPDAAAAKTSNIRLLQDSGVQLEVGSAGNGNLGIVGMVPLRRFEAHQPPSGSSQLSESRPALQPGAGWEPFANALMLVERANSQPRISSRLFKALLVDGSADWSVSGEALMGPSAMASLVRNAGGGSQMLWEWRPPFLDPSEDIPLLERRPFVSVARVPASFRQQIKTMLNKVHDRPVGEEAVNDLLGKLGARGVGLSALLSMGGTHAAGALGFYLAFSLMERLPVDGCEQFVLPIDACDTFLKALASDSNHGGSTRRADLLVVRLDDEAITLIPIEIKFYGLDASGPAPNLPQPGDDTFKRALQQLDSTVGLLRRLQARWTDLNLQGNIAERALWHNGLATLVEAGARLRPGTDEPSSELASRLQRLVDGNIPVKVGRPILTYFRHDSFTAQGRDFAAYLDEESKSASAGRYAALVANAGAAFEQVGQASSEILGAWQDVISWAAAPAPDQEATPAEPAPGEETALTPVPGQAAAEPPAAEQNVLVTVARHPAAEEPLAEASTPPAGNHGPIPPAETGNGKVTMPDGSGVRFPVGELLGRVGKGEAEFWPSNTALNQLNIGVVGDLGTGKTQLLKSLILQLRSNTAQVQQNPLSMLVFDYKRDFQDEQFLQAVGGKVLRPQRIPLNIFALPAGYTPLAAFQRAQAFCDIIGKIYSGVGPVQRDRLVTAITQLYKDQNGRPPTLTQVLERYRDEGGRPDAVTGILNTFVLGEIFSDESESLVPFEELIHDKVLVLALSDLGMDQNAKNALVVLFLNMYYDYMLKAPKWPYVGQDPQLRRLNSFLLVDEAVNIMKYEFPVLMDLMLQGREFGFGVILASQYLSHFRTSGANYGEPLLTWFIHKVPSVSLRELEQLGLTGVPQGAATHIPGLKVHEALYNSLGYPGSFIKGIPFYRLASPQEQAGKPRPEQEAFDENGE
ncbi:hypothetical protein [Arthrobacter sp. USHLN218]|uniref:hypothetical protein n=1 Tax=Arthrobacter sp. USHLN218 TaxID=3081232 RepID=UPI00301ABA6A